MSLDNQPHDRPPANKSLPLSFPFRELAFLFDELKQLITQQEGWEKYCKVMGDLTTPEFKHSREEDSLWECLRRLIDHLIAGYKFGTSAGQNIDHQNLPSDEEDDRVSSPTNIRALEAALQEGEQRIRQQVKKIYELEADLTSAIQRLEKAEKSLEEKGHEIERLHHRLKDNTIFGFRPNSPQGFNNHALTAKDINFLERIEDLLNTSDLEMHHKLWAIREEVHKHRTLKQCYSPTAKEAHLILNGNTGRAIFNIPPQISQQLCAPQTERQTPSNAHHYPPLLNQHHSPGQFKLGSHIPKSKSMRYGLVKLPDCIKMIVKTGCEKISRNASMNENKFRTVLNSVVESNNTNRLSCQGVLPAKLLAGQQSPPLPKYNKYMNPQEMLQQALIQRTSGMKDYVLLNSTRKQDGEPFGPFPE